MKLRRSNSTARTYGLPRALSGHNQYFEWGPVPDAAAENVLRVQRDLDALRPYCRSLRVLGTTHAPYARPLENGKIIALCRGLHPALSSVWPTLKKFI